MSDLDHVVFFCVSHEVIEEHRLTSFFDLHFFWDFFRLLLAVDIVINVQFYWHVKSIGFIAIFTTVKSKSLLPNIWALLVTLCSSQRLSMLFGQFPAESREYRTLAKSLSCNLTYINYWWSLVTQFKNKFRPTTATWRPLLCSILVSLSMRYSCVLLLFYESINSVNQFSRPREPDNIRLIKFPVFHCFFVVSLWFRQIWSHL